MDDLDRLYQHLVASLHAEAPHLLRQRFVIGDLAQQVVPYRLHRRALGFDSIQQYDLALLRLVAGERGYLLTEPVVQDAARQALATPRPEAESLRRFGDAPAMLAPEPLRGLIGDAGPSNAPTPPGGARMTGPGAPGAGAQGAGAQGAAPSADAARPTPAASTPGVQPQGAPIDPSTGAALAPLAIAVDPRSDRAPNSAPLAGAPTPASVPARESAPVRPPQPPAPRPPESQQAPSMPFPTRPPNAVMGGSCRYCGQSLPEGRPVTFCPHCGQNVTIVRCPACSTELEVGWRFCVTCGRTMDGAPSGAPSGAPAG